MVQISRFIRSARERYEYDIIFSDWKGLFFLFRVYPMENEQKVGMSLWGDIIPRIKDEKTVMIFAATGDRWKSAVIFEYDSLFCCFVNSIVFR